MTFSTSAVAVCCCSASARSRVRACTSSNSRTFSIAITAWSAKVCNELDLSLVERSGHEASYQQRALDPVVTQQRHADDGTYARQRVHGRFQFGVGERVANGLRLAGKQNFRPTTDVLPGVAGCSEDIAALPNPRPSATARYLNTSPSRTQIVPALPPIKENGGGHQRLEHQIGDRTPSG